MICVAVSVCRLISADYTANGQCLALCFKSSGKLDVLSLHCTLFIALCCSYRIVCGSMYLFLLALLPFSAVSYSLCAVLSNKSFFHGLPAAFSVLTAEQLRGGGCAHGPSCDAAWCLEEVSLQGWLR